MGGGRKKDQFQHSFPAAQGAVTKRLVRCVHVRTGRHVDCVELVFHDDSVEEYGDAQGGEAQQVFELDVDAREFLVRVEFRQHKHLDGIQFVTNLGRTSPWYGGSGGQPFTMRADPGFMIVGLNVEEQMSFCPKLRGLQLAPKPCPLPRISLLRLLLQKNVRVLSFGGNPSLVRLALQGRPSALRLMLARRAIMLRVMLRGNPCFLRLILDGEQDRAHPRSLFRQMCTPNSSGELSAMQMMMMRDPRDKRSKSLAQLLLSGNPSVARQFFGKKACPLKPLVQMMFENDQVNGYPSLTLLLTRRDEIDGVVHPSVLEAMLDGEQYFADTASKDDKVSGLDDEEEEEDDDDDEEDERMARVPVSLMRLMLKSQGPDQPSLLGLLLEGERDGQGSIVRRIAQDKYNNGLSIARMCLTSFENHKGYRPALSTYIFGGGRVSLLRMMIAAEARPNQLSLMRLLFFKYTPKSRGALVRMGSSFRAKQPEKPAAADDVVGKKPRRSLMDLLTAGKPSIADLFFKGELEGEDSLARLMLGTCVDFNEGYLKLGATLKSGNENGVSLMQWMMLGEEEGGPGISFIRMLLFGEEENGFSILRLMLMNESSNEPSLLRICITALKAVLVAAKTRPSQLRNGEWRATVDKLADAVIGSQKDGSSFMATFQKLSDTLNPNGEQLQIILGVLKTIPKRGKQFQALWKKQWLRVAREVEAASLRAKKKSAWAKMGPIWSRIAHHIAHQSWTRVAAEVALLSSNLKTISRWTERAKRVGAATPKWLIPKALSSIIAEHAASITSALPQDVGGDYGDEAK